jgi:hypothetical protein
MRTIHHPGNLVTNLHWCEGEEYRCVEVDIHEVVVSLRLHFRASPQVT